MVGTTFVVPFAFRAYCSLSGFWRELLAEPLAARS
jgi:hypothetical protein